MENLSLFFTLAFICVVRVNAVCDSTTSSKIQQCVFQSDLFNPGATPKDEKSIQTFCQTNMNSVVDCMEVHVEECADNPKEQKLMDLLVDIDATRNGLLYMCNNITVLQNKVSCFSVFGNSGFLDCVQDAVGTITNSGQPSNLKSGLDMVCRFFDSFTGCFTDPFQDDCAVIGVIYQKVFEGIKYPYCKMSSTQRHAAIMEYEMYTASSTAVSYSLVSILSLLTAAKLFA